MKTEITIETAYGFSGTMILESLSPEFLAWAVARAVRDASIDANAGKAHTAEGKEAVAKKFAYLLQGIPPQAGRGTSGPRESEEDKETWRIIRDLWRDHTPYPLAELDRRCKASDFQTPEKEPEWIGPIKQGLEKANERTLTVDAIKRHIANLVKEEIARKTRKGIVIPD